MRGNYFMIVTRNLHSQDACVLHLRTNRIAVVGVSTCEEAIRLADLVAVSAALFEVEQPEDWDLLAQLRRRLPCEIPLVVFGDRVVADRQSRTRARALGCAGFVTKPAAPHIIAASLQRAAGGSSWSEYTDHTRDPAPEERRPAR